MYIFLIAHRLLMINYGKYIAPYMVKFFPLNIEYDTIII